jgi:hypothetical protein
MPHFGVMRQTYKEEQPTKWSSCDLCMLTLLRYVCFGKNNCITMQNTLIGLVHIDTSQQAPPLG